MQSNVINVGESVSNLGEFVSSWKTFKGYDLGVHNVELFNQLTVTAPNQIVESTVNGLTHYVLTVNNIVLTIDPCLVINNPLLV